VRRQQVRRASPDTPVTMRKPWELTVPDVWADAEAVGATSARPAAASSTTSDVRTCRLMVPADWGKRHGQAEVLGRDEHRSRCARSPECGRAVRDDGAEPPSVTLAG
jgi:hypothetical protein